MEHHSQDQVSQGQRFPGGGRCLLRHMRGLHRFLVCLMVGAGMMSMPVAKADPVPFFADVGASPDVLFVLDASPTMNALVRDINGNPIVPNITRVDFIVNTLKQVIPEYSQQGLRLGIVRTSNSSPLIGACKTGVTLVPIGPNNSAAMLTGLDTYRAATVGGSGVKDFDSGFNTAKSVYTTAINSDLCKSDRLRAVVFVTGGGGSFKLACSDDADTVALQIYNLPGTLGAPSTLKVPVYVTGLNLEDDGIFSLAYARLQAIAAAGGTQTPRSARTSNEFIRILDSILNDLIYGYYTAGAPALSINDEDLYETAFEIYSTQTNPKKRSWEGHLRDFALETDPGVNQGDLITPARWDSGATLTATSYSSRKVFTSIYDSSSDVWTKTQFSTANTSTLYSQLALSTADDVDAAPPGGTSSDATSLIQFVLGDTTRTYRDAGPDGLPLYKESYKLLDIINSSPSYVPPPIFPSLDPDYISTFQAIQKGRPDLILVGSNGGMIHAFEGGTWSTGGERSRSLTGRELWAYTPQHLLPRLRNLWAWDTHTTLSDATGRATDMKICATAACPESTRRWATVYAQADGIAGTQDDCKAAVLASPANSKTWWNCGWYNGLEVSAQSSGTFTVTPLWEFMGYGDLIDASAEPAFGRVRIKVGTDFVTRDVVFVAGRGADENYGNVYKCKTPIYILEAGSGKPLGFQNYNPSNPGLTPTIDSRILLPWRNSSTCTEGDNYGNLGIKAQILAVDTNNDLLTDRLFVGDMQGSMWRIDLSSSNPADWKSKYMEIYRNSSEYPIQFGAAATYNATNGDTLLYFGFGSPQTLSDYLSSPPTGKFLVYKDPRTITSTSAQPLTGFTVPSLGAGEVLAGEPVIANGVVYFTTYTVSSSGCRFGSGRIYGLNYLTGGIGLDSNADGTLDTKYINLGEGIPSGVVIGKNQWYVNINDGDGDNTNPLPSGNVASSGGVSSQVPMLSYSWMDVIGR